MNEKLLHALNEVEDKHIAHAATFKPKRLPYWLGGIAAVLAAVLLIGVLLQPMTLSATAVSEAVYPKYEGKYRPEALKHGFALRDFFGESIRQTLSAAGDENISYSPINLYMALAVSAEITGGNSRQQILDALNAGSMEALRSQANLIWNANYYDDQDQTLLANSLWLDEAVDYNGAVMDTLAANYYTSVYRNDLGSSASNAAIRSWLNQQTGGLLKGSIDKVALDQDILLVLYSTVFYRAMWSEYSEFSAKNNTDGIFHAPDGDTPVTYMNRKEMQTQYYWGADYGAVQLRLKDGSAMWFILPDEGKSANDVLSSPEYLQMIMPGETDYATESDNCKYMKVNLSVPKFDITAESDLKESLQAMGITDMFTPGKADFGTILASDLPLFFTGAKQATRVAIDEEGVTAASYLELPAAGSAMPPEEIIDFVLDRPFLFVITNRYNLPLFAGVVNNP